MDKKCSCCVSLIIMVLVIGATFVMNNTNADATEQKNKTYYKTVGEYERCRERFLKTTKAPTAGVASRLLLKHCGQKPFEMQDCDYLYTIISTECKEIENCSDSEPVCMATMRNVRSMAIDQNTFYEMCRRVCSTKKVPDRTEFENVICH